MRRKKEFKKAVGHYFFNISMGYQNNITISRKTRQEAVNDFLKYQKLKKGCEWLGQWNGKEFVDTVLSEAA